MYKKSKIYTSEYAAKIALSAEIKRDGSARFKVAGMPIEYSFLADLRDEKAVNNVV